jgi:hypothetical protein
MRKSDGKAYVGFAYERKGCENIGGKRGNWLESAAELSPVRLSRSFSSGEWGLATLGLVTRAQRDGTGGVFGFGTCLREPRKDDS